MTGLCSDDIPYNYLNIELEFYIIKFPPFQGIIGSKAIKHSLIKHFPTLSKTDIDHEAREGYAFNDNKELPPYPVTLSRVLASVAQSYSQGSDGDPWKEYPNIDGHIGAVLEHCTPPPGLVRRKDELLSLITADDDDDEILPEVDTFAPFTERATGTQPLLKLVKLGDNSELNNRIEELITKFEPQNLLSMTLSREHALIKPFEIKIDETLWKVPQNRLPFGYRP